MILPMSRLVKTLSVSRCSIDDVIIMTLSLKLDVGKNLFSNFTLYADNYVIATSMFTFTNNDFDTNSDLLSVDVQFFTVY